MIRFIFRLLIGAFGLWLATEIVPGVAADGWKTLLIAALLLGIVNAVVRPIVTVLTFPLTLATLGLFLLVVVVFCFVYTKKSGNPVTPGGGGGGGPTEVPTSAPA